MNFIESKRTISFLFRFSFVRLCLPQIHPQLVVEKLKNWFCWISFDGIVGKGHCTVFASLRHSSNRSDEITKKMECLYCLHTFPLQILPGATAQNTKECGSIWEKKESHGNFCELLFCVLHRVFCLSITVTGGNHSAYALYIFVSHQLFMHAHQLITCPVQWPSSAAAAASSSPPPLCRCIGIIRWHVYLLFGLWPERLVTHMHWICVHKRCRSRTHYCVHLLNYRVPYCRSCSTPMAPFSLSFFDFYYTHCNYEQIEKDTRAHAPPHHIRLIAEIIGVICVAVLFLVFRFFFFVDQSQTVGCVINNCDIESL